MPTVDRFDAVHLAAVTTTTGAGDNQILFVLAAVGLLMLTARLMWRSVGPVIEIIKAALFAVMSFLLITVVVVLLLYTVVTR
jgi:hypothetical protein